MYFTKNKTQVILAKLLCWDLSELRYLKLNARKGNRVRLMTKKDTT